MAPDATPNSTAPVMTGVPPPPPPMAPPPPRKKRSPWIVVVAVVVIIVLLLALLLSGIIPGFKTSSSKPSGPSYNVTFSETGLPSGTSWSVTLGGTTLTSTTSTILFSEQNGTYSYSVGAVAGYAASPSSGSVTVSGKALSETITFTTSYAVTFTESGLPTGTMWSVTLNGTTNSSTGTSIGFSKPNGIYPYSVGEVTGYAATPSSGSVTVNGMAVTVTITFTAIPPGTYAVTFTESGLPTGTSWSVTLAGSPMSSLTNTITFYEMNGTPSYTVGAVSGYTATPSSGSVTVNGKPVSVTIVFTKSPGLRGAEYAVTFDQTGLPATDLWEVDCVPLVATLLVFSVDNTGASTEFAIPNATYFWHVSTGVAGYVAVPVNGTVTVAGAAVTVMVKFLALYPVNFTETGLTAGASWNVTLNGTTSSATAPGNVTFLETNDTYSFAAAAFGYTSTDATGSVTVSGAPVSKAITFLALPTYAVTFTESGLTSGTNWDLLLNGTVGFATAPSTIVFDFPNGVYPFSGVSAYPGYWTASPSSGSLTVSGAPVMQAIAFTAIKAYNVTFTETGLTAGTLWSASLNVTSGSATAPASITLKAPAGVNLFSVFASGYTAKPASGNVTVTSGTNTEPIVFTAIPPVTTYSVMFNESGLPPTSDWEVLMQNDGRLISASYYCTNASVAGTPLNCSVPNGNYSWAAYTYTMNYTADPMAGYLTVNGAALTVNVTYVNTSMLDESLVAFSEESYNVFGTGGVPNGTTWSVTLGSTTQHTEGMWIYFLVPNGTKESYTITPPTGYLAVPGSGSVTGYFNASQAALFAELSPFVWVVFVSTDPPGGLAAISVGYGSTGVSFGTVMAVARDS